jgi:hypothetical protein
MNDTPNRPRKDLPGTDRNLITTDRYNSNSETTPDQPYDISLTHQTKSNRKRSNPEQDLRIPANQILTTEPEGPIFTETNLKDLNPTLATHQTEDLDGSPTQDQATSPDAQEQKILEHQQNEINIIEQKLVFMILEGLSIIFFYMCFCQTLYFLSDDESPMGKVRSHDNNFWFLL